MATYLVTKEPTGYNWSEDQFFKSSRVRADLFLDMRRRTGEFARLLCIESDGAEPVELAHVRNGVLYDGLTSQVDWADLGQVIDIWEKAKGEILARLGDDEKPGSEFVRFVDDVIRSMGLPAQWAERLQRAVMKMRPEIESSLVLSLDEWPSIPSSMTDSDEQ